MIEEVIKNKKSDFIPVGWKSLKIGDFLSLEYGKALKEKDRNSGNVFVYGSNGLIGFHNKRLVEGPGVIVGRKGSAGEVTYCDRDFYPIDTAYFVKTDLNIKFVYYLLKNVDFKKIVGSSAVPGLNRNDVYSQKIKIPIEEGERNEITKILSSPDDKIELNRKINSNLEKIASLLFKQWFVDFEFPNESGKPFKSSGGKMIDSELGEIPYSWTVGKLGDCFDIKYGKSDKDISEDGAYSVYGAGGLLGFSNTFDYKGPQVIVGCRGTCGNISIIFEDSKITHNSLIISNEWGNFFLYLYLKNINIKDVITGSTQPQITIKDLSSLNVLLPSKEIVDTFSQIIDPLFLNIKTNLLENIYLNKIRDSLLPRLMNGKIRVKI